MCLVELRALMELIESLNITLLPRYISSELNPADEFSRLTNREACHLQPSVQQMLLHQVKSILCSSVTLDAFTCHQSRVCQSFSSRHSMQAALASNGLVLDWWCQVVLLN
jgi:hypothetical protein